MLPDARPNRRAGYGTAGLNCFREGWRATVFEAMPMTVGVFRFCPKHSIRRSGRVALRARDAANFFPRYIFRKANLSVAAQADVRSCLWRQASVARSSIASSARLGTKILPPILTVGMSPRAAAS